MFFSNLFKKKDVTESPMDLENDYLKLDINSNIYGFQKKFYMQSDKILKYVSKEKIYALLGNHDSNYIDNYGFNNLNGQIIEYNGIKMMGIQGSFKYKPIDFPSFTQEDSIKFLLDKECVDILFSHDGPFDDSMINNPAHQGLFGITYYLYKNKVKYNVHGHLHEDYDKTLSNGTIEKCLFGVRYIELD